ncbi:hypothetical protein [Streptomyces sp. YIM 132580]|uniref:hypothetical protein n=1 Tax=Streptomyces sp. YIM 132580 TaxID=2691958 RepID=UPI001368B3B6|nr:hypothetical protein [Streptomyces sp. YIM 132580]MXG26713.1 hypothetical protein [Streptomyces sp. YIM 132580]
MEIEDFYIGNSIDLLENRIATRVADGIGPQALTTARSPRPAARSRSAQRTPVTRPR